MFRNESGENIIKKVEHLTSEDRLSEAMEILKPVFSEKHVHKTVFKLLNQIVTKALEKNDLALAINAASYREGWFGYIEVPESASWNTILHKVLPGEFPATDIPNKFLTPGTRVSAPFKLSDIACKIWKHFQENNWEIPGFDVVFDSYGPGRNSDNPILLHKVSEIRGKDFIIGFSGRQGLAEGQQNWTDSAGLNYIAVPNFVMEFYNDHSGPTVYEYAGDKWQENIANMSHYSSIMDKIPGWKKVECHIPGNNNVLIEHLFDFNKNAQETQSRQKSGRKIQQALVEKAVLFFEKTVLKSLSKTSNMGMFSQVDASESDANSPTPLQSFLLNGLVGFKP